MAPIGKCLSICLDLFSSRWQRSRGPRGGIRQQKLVLKYSEVYVDLTLEGLD